MRGCTTSVRSPLRKTRSCKTSLLLGRRYVPVFRVFRSKADHHKPHYENLTGTRGAYKPYNTTKPKYEAWEPKVAQRSG